MSLPANRIRPYQVFAVILSIMGTTAVQHDTIAQQPRLRYGVPISKEVTTLYESGLRYLVQTQRADGTWNSQYGNGPGITGLCCLAIISCGEDPNYGMYADTLRRGLRSIVKSQDPQTGFLAKGQNHHGSMYEHGFATLTLAEAYGAVDGVLMRKGENQTERDPSQPTVGQALELAVRCILTSQNQNPYGAWRYQPKAKDADVSVSGAMLVGLLAARNAGIEVPDANIERALQYFEKATMSDGSVMYVLGSGGGESMARSSISCLVFAIARKKDTLQHKQTLEYIKTRMETPPRMHKYYTRYYMAQALFQGDFEAWNKWNQLNTQLLKEEQTEQGSIGPDAYSTSMSLLSMALNYRFLPIYER